MSVFTHRVFGGLGKQKAYDIILKSATNLSIGESIKYVELGSNKLVSRLKRLIVAVFRGGFAQKSR